MFRTVSCRKRFTAWWEGRNVLWSLSRIFCSTAPPCPVSQRVRDTGVILWFMSLQPFQFMLNHGPWARLTVADLVSYSSCCGEVMLLSTDARLFFSPMKYLGSFSSIRINCRLFIPEEDEKWSAQHLQVAQVDIMHFCAINPSTEVNILSIMLGMLHQHKHDTTQSVLLKDYSCVNTSTNCWVITAGAKCPKPYKCKTSQFVYGPISQEYTLCPLVGS